MTQFATEFRNPRSGVDLFIDGVNRLPRPAMAFGVLGVKPIPIIILAQALNGLLLPFVAAFLLLVVNDKKLMPAEFRNSTGLNLVSLLVVAVSIVLGLNQVMKASFSALSLELPALGTYLFMLIGLSVLISAYLAYRIFK